jgi:hypothetical protein
MVPGGNFALTRSESLAQRGYGTRPIVVASAMTARQGMKRDLYADVSARIVAELEVPAGAGSGSALRKGGVMVEQPTERGNHEPLYDIDPLTGASVEVFYADRTPETFGRCGAGWFWWSRRNGFSPDGPATGPFATSYAAYRHAISYGQIRSQVQGPPHTQARSCWNLFGTFSEG